MSTNLDKFIDLIKSGDYVILDTETTGLNNGEICQIAIIDSDGYTLLNSLVKPTCSIPDEASRVHGITNERVARAATWTNVAPVVEEIIRDRNVIVYNADYDYRMFRQSSKAVGIPQIPPGDWQCAMLTYAEFYGDWNDYRGNYRWQRLSDAATQQNIKIENAHDALGDCLMTLGVLKAMTIVKEQS